MKENKKNFVVIGCGRFGSSLAKTLYDSGYEVMIIDNNEWEIENIKDRVTKAVVADVEDEAAMESLGLRNFDVAVIAIGSNLEASIIATLIAKEMGIEYVIAKAVSKIHAKILEKTGADRIIFPERDIGIRTANSLIHTNFLERISLGSDYTFAELSIPENWTGKTLLELDLRNQFQINVIGIKVGENKMEITPDPNTPLEKNSILFVVGNDDDINKL